MPFYPSATSTRLACALVLTFATAAAAPPVAAGNPAPRAPRRTVEPAKDDAKGPAATRFQPSRRPLLHGRGAKVRMQKPRRQTRRSARRRAAPLRINPKTPYSGVVPDKNNPPPGKPPAPKTRCVLLWPGFQLTATGSRVFLQFNTKPNVQMRRQGKRIIVRMDGCRIPMRNNRRRLDTRFFPTPVRALRARKVRGGVEVVVHMKTMVFPAKSWKKKGKYAFFILEFAHAEASSRPAPHSSREATDAETEKEARPNAERRD